MGNIVPRVKVSFFSLTVAKEWVTGENRPKVPADPIYSTSHWKRWINIGTESKHYHQTKLKHSEKKSLKYRSILKSHTDCLGLKQASDPFYALRVSHYSLSTDESHDNKLEGLAHPKCGDRRHKGNLGIQRNTCSTTTCARYETAF